MSEVTEKNTKKEILYAYKKAQEQISALEAKVFDPKTKEKSNISVDLLETVAEEILSLSAEYHEINELIESKKLELKEIYDIEKEANSLVALVNAQTLKKEEFDEIEKQRMDEINQMFNQEEERYKTRQKTIKTDLEDLDIDYERKKKLLSTKLDDLKIQHEKDLVSKREELLEEVSERELLCETRERQITERETNYQANFDFEKKSYMLEKDAELKDLENRLKTQLKANLTFEHQVAELKEQLKEANARINDLATKSMGKPVNVNVSAPKAG